MATFSATYTGRCGQCGDLFEPGARVSYNDDDVLVGFYCCGNELDEHHPADSEVTPRDQVMPRGKTSRDACPRCFQVPASCGACGCDS
jgi:hypothetical protein